jgi:hypothetical protein
MRLPRAVPRSAIRGESRATIVLRKIDAAARPVRHIELCNRHAEIMIARERASGLEILDRRDWR